MKIDTIQISRGDSENYRPTAWPTHLFRKPGIKVI